MPNACDKKQLIERYETLRELMKDRIEEIAKPYENSQPLKQYFALLHTDEELEKLDHELCELECLLPDSYQYNTLA